MYLILYNLFKKTVCVYILYVYILNIDLFIYVFNNLFKQIHLKNN